jgi:hypothetical protein
MAQVLASQHLSHRKRQDSLNSVTSSYQFAIACYEIITVRKGNRCMLTVDKPMFTERRTRVVELYCECCFDLMTLQEILRITG